MQTAMSRRYFLCMVSVLVRACVGAAVTAVATAEAAAEEKTFLMTPQVCSSIGGRASISNEQQDFYTEIVGSVSGRPAQMCVAGWLGVRDCIAVTLYNFKVVCRGGIVSAPNFYMALFGNDKNNIENGVSVSGDRLSFIEQSGDVFQKYPRRVAFPDGSAPFPDLQSRIKQLDWDASDGHPVVARKITDEQRKRIGALFVASGNYVEPFPVARLNQVIAISEEPQVSPAPPTVVENSKPADAGQGRDGNWRLDDKTKLQFALAVVAFFIGLCVRGTALLAKVLIMTCTGVCVFLLKHALGIPEDTAIFPFLPLGVGFALAFIWHPDG